MINTIVVADLPEIPWKNGAGVTRELLRRGTDPFDLRVSVASVASSGPFSLFPEHDRLLILLDGALRLNFERESISLRARVPLFFSGEESVSSELLTGPLTDFNVFFRKGRQARASIEAISGPVHLDGSTLLFHLDQHILFEGNGDFEAPAGDYARVILF